MFGRTRNESFKKVDMQNKLNKLFFALAIVTGGIFVPFFGVSATALASTTFNTDGQDYPTILVSNYSENPGCEEACWETSIDAEPGDTIAVLIYFHNTGNETAIDPILKLSPKETGTGDDFTFTGTVDADNASPVSDSATVHLSEDSSISYDDGFYPKLYMSNPATSPVTLPFGQDGDELFTTGGLELNDILDDDTCSGNSFCHQGSLVVHYKVAEVEDENECDDGIDNDDDGETDYPDDEGCSSSSDNSEDSDEDDGNGNFEVNTLNEEDVETDSAKLFGEVDGIEDDSFTVERWFEWSEDEGDVEDGDGDNLDVSGDTDEDGEFSKTLEDLDEDTTYYFRACAENEDGDTECGDVENFTTDEENNNNDDDNECEDNVDNDDDGDEDYPDDEGCSSSNDDSEDSEGDDFASFDSETTSPNSITQSSARLNGVVANNDAGDLTGWFEWGATMSLVNKTPEIFLGSTDSVNYFNTIIGLSANTTYYFRAVAEDEDGSLNYGEILSFRTLGASVVPQPPVVIVSGTGTGSPFVMLEITADDETAYVGEPVDFTVTYKNISGKVLENTVLEISLPDEIDFIDTTEGEYSISDHSIIVEIGDLEINEEDEFFIDGEITRKAIPRDLLVTDAVMAFENPSNGATEDATAYALITVRDRSNLVGLALFGAGFWPDTLIEWLLLIAIIFGLVYLARRLSEKKSVLIERTTATVESRGTSPDNLPR